MGKRRKKVGNGKILEKSWTWETSPVSHHQEFYFDCTFSLVSVEFFCGIKMSTVNELKEF